MKNNRVSKTVEIESMENNEDTFIYYVTAGWYEGMYEITVSKKEEGVIVSSAWREIADFPDLLSAFAFLDKQ